MGVNARAKLFYGVVEKQDKLLKLADKFFGEESEEYEDDEWEKLENFGTRIGCDMESLAREGWDEEDNDRYAVAAWCQTTYDFDDIEAVKMPKQEVLDKKWAKVAAKLGIRKKPRWYLWTEYS